MKDPHADPYRRWHAVFCKPQQDARAEHNLLHQGFEIFRPKTRTRKTLNGRRRTLVESLFPRYLFVRLSRQGQDWAPIRSTRGAVGLVRVGQETPTVPDFIIEDLRQRCDAQGICNLNGSIDYQPDDLVEIIDGPCAGYRALFKTRTSQDRVIVLLKLLQHQRELELDEVSIRRA